MKKIIAWLLLALAILMVLGMVINNHLLWFVIDILVIAGCFTSGVFLMLEKK